MSQLPALARRLSEIVAEYDEKKAAIPDAVAAFEAAGTAVKTACTIAGVWGDTTINTGQLYERNLEDCLLKSAWRHVYQGLQIETVATAKDKKKFDEDMQNPPEFTLDNIRASFGAYIKDPMSSILRGLAEVFSGLDPAYKSHEKVKIGVDGLPKRVIIGQLNSFYGRGMDQVRDILNALAAYQGKPLVSRQELAILEKDGDALRDGGAYPDPYASRYNKDAPPISIIGRGVWLKKFKNGNGHLFFDPPTLKDINRALAAYYGDVLPDCHEEKPTNRRESTQVSKDLQYYPTPTETVERVVSDIYVKGMTVLEPSCGCGRFMDSLKANGAKVTGYEIDPGRVQECRAKGHKVIQANFLDTNPAAGALYDRVVMNPPFYGRHYAKHVRHALKFLKTDGVLTCILPATARYDHGELDDLNGTWWDLPVGAFRESGTNIQTTVLTVRKRDAK